MMGQAKIGQHEACSQLDADLFSGISGGSETPGEIAIEAMSGAGCVAAFMDCDGLERSSVAEAFEVGQ